MSPRPTMNVLEEMLAAKRPALPWEEFALVIQHTARETAQQYCAQLLRTKQAQLRRLYGGHYGRCGRGQQYWRR